MNPLIRLIPAGLVRAFARRYIAGDSVQHALDTAAGMLQSDGMLATLDLLAEDIETQAIAQNNLETYLDLIDAVAADARFTSERVRPSVSVKLSSYTTAPLDKGGDGAGSCEAASAIVALAQRRDVRVTIDMENSRWTDFTLDLLDELHAAANAHVGIVLQTRLDRTEADIDRLPSGCRVRLVIGIYNEPADIATTDKTEMKERLLVCAEKLLKRGHYVELATHDERYVRRFVAEVVPRAGADPDRFEIQMLYGVPRASVQRKLVADGVVTRLYIPFSLGWPMAIAYLRRRLDEYPWMMFLVAKNLFTGE